MRAQPPASWLHGQKSLDSRSGQHVRGPLIGVVHIEATQDRRDFSLASGQFGANAFQVDLFGGLYPNRDLYAHLLVIAPQGFEQQKAVDMQMNEGKTCVIEIMCTSELGDAGARCSPRLAMRHKVGGGPAQPFVFAQDHGQSAA